MFTLFFDNSKFPLFKGGDKTLTHPVPLFVVNKTTTATSIIITATAEYFAGDQRGEKHFHTERMILSEKSEQFFCYVEKNKYFYHLHYNFFFHFFPRLCIVSFFMIAIQLC